MAVANNVCQAHIAVWYDDFVRMALFFLAASPPS
jgi:hypothetical protein